MKVPGVLVAPGSCAGGEERQEGNPALAEAPAGMDVSIWQRIRMPRPTEQRG